MAKQMKKGKSVVSIVCVAALVLSLSACGNNVSTRDIEWPTSDLASMLPVPTTLKGEIIKNNYDLFSVEISKSSEEDYEDYVEACKDKGFTVDAEEEDEKYSAFNEDGYILTLTYHPNDKYFAIELDEPWYEAGATFSWPPAELGDLLPEPASNVGKIKNDSSDYFKAYVGDSTLDDFNDYIDACIDAGFDVDYFRSDTHFDAKNEAGDSLSIIYEGFDTFYIDLSAY